MIITKDERKRNTKLYFYVHIILSFFNYPFTFSVVYNEDELSQMMMQRIMMIMRTLII